MSESAATALTAERTQKWDILRFAMIFFVVLGHYAEYYTDGSEQVRSLFMFIYTFHMPVFIFVSGLFSKKAIDEKRKDKLIGYLIIYLLCKVISLMYRTIGGSKPSISIFSEGGVPWFMLALFAFSVITIFIKEYSPLYVLSFSLLLACVAGYDKEIGDFLSLSRIIVYYPFFYAGYIIDRNKLEKFCDSKAIKIISAIILIVFAVFVFTSGDDIYWLRLLITGRNSFYKLSEYAELGLFIRALYYIFVTVICGAIIVVTPDKTPFGIIPKMGQRTLAVYVFHYTIVHFMYNVFGFKEMFEKLIPGNSWWVIIPISLIVTVLLSAKPFHDLLMSVITIPKRK